VKRLLLVAVLAMILALALAAPALAAPANDNFANAIVLSGTSGSVAATTVEATGQAGEPSPGSMGQLNSVWYKWTAPTSASMIAEITAGNYDTYLAIYTGSALNALTLVDYDDDSGDGLLSYVTFPVTSGTTYYIQVDGFSIATGSFTLAWSRLVDPLSLEGLAVYIEDQADAGNIGTSLEGRLLDLVNPALAAFNAGNPKATNIAIKNLQGLIKVVKYQTARNITPEVAQELIFRANSIIAILRG